jgi:hypothetical protein
MRFRHYVLLVALLSGCYVYEPVTTASPPTGRAVRLTLTDAGTANLASELGPSVEAVGGKLIGDTSDAYVLALSDSRKRNGVEIDWRGEQVSISKSLIATIQQREFSRARTTFVAAGLIAALFVARQTLWGPGGVFGSAPPGPGPGPQ